jgi:hypothetical protein
MQLSTSPAKGRVLAFLSLNLDFHIAPTSPMDINDSRKIWIGVCIRKNNSDIVALMTHPCIPSLLCQVSCERGLFPAGAFDYRDALFHSSLLAILLFVAHSSICIQ